VQGLCVANQLLLKVPNHTSSDEKRAAAKLDKSLISGSAEIAVRL